MVRCYECDKLIPLKEVEKVRRTESTRITLCKKCFRLYEPVDITVTKIYRVYRKK